MTPDTCTVLTSEQVAAVLRANPQLRPIVRVLRRHVRTITRMMAEQDAALVQFQADLAEAEARGEGDSLLVLFLREQISDLEAAIAARNT